MINKILDFRCQTSQPEDYASGGKTFRRIVLVALPSLRDKDQKIPLGHASLLAALRTESMLDVRSIVWPINDDVDTATDAVSTILKQVAGMPCTSVDVAIGAYIWNDDLLKKILSLLRNRGFKGRIVLGGPQISYAKNDLEQLYPEVNVFIRGYAEDALRGLSLHCGKPRIQGVHYAGEADSCEQADVNFEGAASPWLNGTIQTNGQTFIHWETQRGCRFKCSFCQHRQPSKKSRGKFCETRVMEEIALFCRAGIKRITVVDPVFNSDSSFATRILREFAKYGFQGELSLQCRPELLNDDFLDATKGLKVCLEFGLQSIHKLEYRTVGRRNSIRKVGEVLAKVRQRNIEHEVSLIYGLPEQTLASFQSTVNQCLAWKIPVIKAFPLLLLRGTALEQEREKWGLKIKEDGPPIVIGSDTFNFNDWTKMGQMAEALRSTERNHPARIEDLLLIANKLTPEAAQWRRLPN